MSFWLSVPINHVDIAVVSVRDLQAFRVQCYVLSTPAWFTEPKITNVQVRYLPIRHPDPYFKLSYSVLTLILGRFLSGFLDAFFERRRLVQGISWRKWRAGHCSFPAAETMGEKVRPSAHPVCGSGILFAIWSLLLFSHLLYSAHILTSFLTGRITRQWLFLGSGLIKMEISWILELGKLFKKGSWQGIFAQDFMCKGWI